jgi:hypothetical protein
MTWRGNIESKIFGVIFMYRICKYSPWMMSLKKVEKMRFLFSDKKGQGVNDVHGGKSWPTKDMDIRIECSIICEEITTDSE